MRRRAIWLDVISGRTMVALRTT